MRPMHEFARLATLSLSLTAMACGGGATPPPPEPYDPAAHQARVEQWRTWRHEQLNRPRGWISLAGLYWLEPGVNTIGGDPAADLVVARPGTPSLLGRFDVAGEAVSFAPADGVSISVAGVEFAEGVVWQRGHDAETRTLEHGTLAWFVIERGGRLGVRLSDSDSPLLRAFTGMEYFPLSPRWRLDGRFEPYDPPRTIMIPNILGTVGEEPSEGAAVFVVDGTEYRIDLWRDSDDPANFFTAFADTTNGDTTYGGGRFLWIDAPDEYGRLEIDFNRSYNPPCAFTPFATCPLPPPQNRMELHIEAGEKSFASPSLVEGG